MKPSHASSITATESTYNYPEVLLALFLTYAGVSLDCVSLMSVDHVWFDDEPRREIYVPDCVDNSCGYTIFLEDEAFRYLNKFLIIRLAQASANPADPLLANIQGDYLAPEELSSLKKKLHQLSTTAKTSRPKLWSISA